MPRGDCYYCGVSVHVPHVLMLKKPEATVGIEIKRLAVPAASHPKGLRK
ncbi:MAG: hypothetical protein ACP5JW_03655 [Candidatus Bathyarchaeia archaeon]